MKPATLAAGRIAAALKAETGHDAPVSGDTGGTQRENTPINRPSFGGAVVWGTAALRPLRAVGGPRERGRDGRRNSDQPVRSRTWGDVAAVPGDVGTIPQLGASGRSGCPSL